MKVFFDILVNTKFFDNDNNNNKTRQIRNKEPEMKTNFILLLW